MAILLKDYEDIHEFNMSVYYESALYDIVLLRRHSADDLMAISERLLESTLYQHVCQFNMNLYYV